MKWDFPGACQQFYADSVSDALFTTGIDLGLLGETVAHVIIQLVQSNKNIKSL